MAVRPSPTDHLNARTRIPALDTLRAFAILWVILLHLGGGGYLPTITDSSFNKFLRTGDAGVDLFFVLSGYLISSIVLTEITGSSRLNVRRFWYRRWMRTLPAYYVTLALIGLGDFFYTPAVPWTQSWSYFCFMQTSVMPFYEMRFGWSWSLCVEELFYFCLPLIVGGLHRMRLLQPVSLFRLLALVALATSVLARAYLADGTYLGGHTPGYAIPYCRLDGIAVGMFIATLHPLQSFLRSMLLGSLSLALLAVYIWSERPYAVESQRFFPLSLLFGALVHASISNAPWRNMRIWGVAGIANVSYALYLVHPIVAIFVVRLTPELHWVIRLVVFAMVTIAAACFMRYAIELPFLRLRDRRPRTISSTS